jgi:hypothetical protein
MECCTRTAIWPTNHSMHKGEAARPGGQRPVVAIKTSNQEWKQLPLPKTPATSA